MFVAISGLYCTCSTPVMFHRVLQVANLRLSLRTSLGTASSPATTTERGRCFYFSFSQNLENVSKVKRFSQRRSRGDVLLEYPTPHNIYTFLYILQKICYLKNFYYLCTRYFIKHGAPNSWDFCRIKHVLWV